MIAPEVVAAAVSDQVPHSPQEAAALAARGKLDGDALYVQINRWEPGDETLHPRSVLVALEARTAAFVGRPDLPIVEAHQTADTG